MVTITCTSRGIFSAPIVVLQSKAAIIGNFAHHCHEWWRKNDKTCEERNGSIDVLRRGCPAHQRAQFVSP